MLKYIVTSEERGASLEKASQDKSKCLYHEINSRQKVINLLIN